jgi:bifunctional DNA-binding transcriptional regulator/antitoxin component of YhaV-PrlF toxin-antitoxin module
MHEVGDQGAFTAEVLAAGQGGGHAVVVPKEIAAAFDSKRPPVLAHVNGVEYRSRLMVYGGRSYLGLRKDLLRQLGVGPGDQIEIELVEDHQERVVVEPAELTQALADNAAAKAAYEKLPFTHRNEYARWIDEGKKPETRADRVAKTIRRLTQPR